MAYEPYANGWPDLKKLDEIAKKIDNVPTFTSEDKRFLEDLFEEQAAAIAFDNTGTDFQSDNVEDAIKEAATMGAGGVDYSTDETEVGTYLGDTLYQKTARVLFNDLSDKSIGASRCYGALKTFIPDNIKQVWIDMGNSFYELKIDSTYSVKSAPLVDMGALSSQDGPYARTTIQKYMDGDNVKYQIYFDTTVFAANINNDATAAYVNVTVKYTKVTV